MSFVPNSLLQASAAVKPQADPVIPAPTVVAPPKDNAFSFAQVYQNTQSNPAQVAFNPVKPMADKAPVVASKPDAPASNANNQDAAPQSSVAGSGKSLPADKTTKVDGKTASADDKGAPDKTAADGTTASTDTSKSDDKTASSDDTGTTTDTPVAVATPDPTVDPALLQAAAAATPVPAAAAPVDPTLIQAPLATAVKAATTPATAPGAGGDFDPSADPLDNLPAVRLAMEQGGHVSSGSQTSAKSTDNTNTDATDSTLAQNQANNVVTMLDQKTDPGSSDQGGDKSFKSLIDDGLKDIKSASSDTRVDDFANRLAALTQAATPKSANALPVNQPLAMHQSGWSEEVVNRVMYLSSANLKSAEIQLQPAELGRLDIKVNMSADQPTQISFISAHAGVRDALEGNMPRLRDMLQQQGLGQADVSVSDQARGWAGQGQGAQQQQQQAQKGSGTGASLGDDSQDDLSIAAVSEAAAVSASVVVGSSAVDYYA
ncbi:flagellar hook-length control protein FliK [Pseudomonas gingeri]|uniref:flagellar hook-length control protein FliK n=1 Tax=Pseudomonas gingeri TaxID=117681 RepID=UPI0015A16A97|nr:flagellar hook-length control protein FliK [Pseudomonas gingeri]NWA26257.1 flagellar hook-length control protein FliK [Pseudomonas gingeri]NWD67770.1 flagellar hook-length control protein FliK [Pseudomonas gingeri]